MEDRRTTTIGRRSNDRVDFAQCPRYDRYELTQEQIKMLAKEVYAEAKKEATLEVGEYVISSGKSILKVVFLIIGAAGIAVAAWMHNVGIKF